jgi:outer membrane protein assembly factor BamB
VLASKGPQAAETEPRPRKPLGKGLIVAAAVLAQAAVPAAVMLWLWSGGLAGSRVGDIRLPRDPQSPMIIDDRGRAVVVCRGLRAPAGWRLAVGSLGADPRVVHGENGQGELVGVVDGLAIINTWDTGTVWALKAIALDGGKTAWAVKGDANTPVDSPHWALLAGRVAIAFAGSKLMALDVETGHLIWLEYPDPQHMPMDDQVGAGLLLESRDDDANDVSLVTARDPSTGKVLWQGNAGLGVKPMFSAGGKVVLGWASGGPMDVRDARTGKLLLRRPGAFPLGLTQDRLVYVPDTPVGASHVNVSCVEVGSWKRVWQLDMPLESSDADWIVGDSMMYRFRVGYGPNAAMPGVMVYSLEDGRQVFDWGVDVKPQQVVEQGGKAYVLLVQTSVEDDTKHFPGGYDRVEVYRLH